MEEQCIYQFLEKSMNSKYFNNTSEIWFNATLTFFNNATLQVKDWSVQKVPTHWLLLVNLLERQLHFYLHFNKHVDTHTHTHTRRKTCWFSVPKFGEYFSASSQSSIQICGNKMATRCNRGFYCRSYCLLNMFRAPLCPSSGAQEYYTVGYVSGLQDAAASCKPDT